MSAWLRRYWTDIAIAALALGAGWIILTARLWPVTTGGAIPAPREGFQAPDIELRNIQGEMVSLRQLRGKAVLVNFWASWCPPCKAEMPALEKVYTDYQAKGLEVLAVNATNQDTLAAIKNYLTQNSLHFPVLVDPDGSAYQRYQVQALPTSFFVDAQGVIRKVVIGGPMSEAMMRAEIDQMLREDN